MLRKIERTPMWTVKACKKTPYVAKPAPMPIKIALAVTAVAMVAIGVALAVVEAVLVAATLVVAFGANPYRKQISI
jgi:uncharacterized membrane protein YphA (DoxX/SURF4 family)